MRPTIENEAAEITVFVKVLEDPTGVLWHNFVKYVTAHPVACRPNIPLVTIRRKKLVL